jgi:hypothetical protein
MSFMLHRFSISLLAALSLFLLSHTASAEPVRIDYLVTFLPAKKSAEVRIEIDQADWLKQVRFNLEKHELNNIKASGKIERSEQAVIWRPKTKGKAYFSYTIGIPLQRSPGVYRAMINKDWTLLRGEGLIPPLKVSRTKKVEREIYVSFSLPEDWTSVQAGWPRTADNERVFKLDRGERALVRPYGWIIAGALGTRREQLARTEVAISAPRGQNYRQMEMMTFLGMIWPHIDKLFPEVPANLLIAGATDPMWRGGLSAPTSLYMHAERPLVSENGTSTLIHELVHVLSGIRGVDGEDWIAEGLAEYFSVELIYRAGGFTDARRGKIFADLAAWGKDVKALRQPRSSGPVTARAAVFFDELDREIQQKSDGRYRFDHLMQNLIETKYVGIKDLQTQYKNLLKAESPLLNSELAR